MATVVDASGATLGRLSSMLAKRLLEGEEIIVVNSEKAIIVGSKKEIENRYRGKREVGGSKRKGPFYSEENGEGYATLPAAKGQKSI